MSVFLAILVIAGLFVLRFAVPFALATVICYGMNRMCDRWEAQAQT